MSLLTTLGPINIYWDIQACTIFNFFQAYAHTAFQEGEKAEPGLITVMEHTT